MRASGGQSSRSLAVKSPHYPRDAPDTLSVVAHVARQPQLVCKLPDEGTKSYPLHLAAHPKLYAVNAHCSLKQQR